MDDRFDFPCVFDEFFKLFFKNNFNSTESGMKLFFIYPIFKIFESKFASIANDNKTAFEHDVNHSWYNFNWIDDRSQDNKRPVVYGTGLINSLSRLHLLINNRPVCRGAGGGGWGGNGDGGFGVDRVRCVIVFCRPHCKVFVQIRCMCSSGCLCVR